ncbi:hypothetical protein [Nostoc sp. C052]|nr:hypothetical protein [Nostoc sp. C052]
MKVQGWDRQLSLMLRSPARKVGTPSLCLTKTVELNVPSVAKLARAKT